MIIEVIISDHPDPNKNLKRKAVVVFQNTKFTHNEAILDVAIEHYDSIDGVDGATETVKNATEKDVMYMRTANNITRVDAVTGVTVPDKLYLEDGSFDIDPATNRAKINPDWITAIPEFDWIKSLPISWNSGTSKLEIGGGAIILPTNDIRGYSEAINSFYIQRFDANGYFGIELYQ